MTAAPTLVDDLLDSEAIRFGTFTLASGQTSDVYVDVKRATTDPARLARIAHGLAAHLGPEERLAGMELGAVPLVVALALESGRPYVIVRKGTKSYGTKQRYEGEVPTGSRVLVVEDVVTTGGSVAETVEILRDAGGTVDRDVCVVDREQGGAERLASAGVRLESLATLAEVRRARR